jgi:hypothetical protein
MQAMEKHRHEPSAIDKQADNPFEPPGRVSPMRENSTTTDDVLQRCPANIQHYDQYVIVNVLIFQSS